MKTKIQKKLERWNHEGLPLLKQVGYDQYDEYLDILKKYQISVTNYHQDYAALKEYYKDHPNFEKSIRFLKEHRIFQKKSNPFQEDNNMYPTVILEKIIEDDTLNNAIGWGLC